MDFLYTREILLIMISISFSLTKKLKKGSTSCRNTRDSAVLNFGSTRLRIICACNQPLLHSSKLIAQDYDQNLKEKL